MTRRNHEAERPSPDAFLAPFPAHVQQVAQRLRELIKETMPHVSEAVYPGWHLIGYRHHEGKRSYYFCFVAPLAEEVRLGFEYGVELTDEHGLLAGEGRQVRYVPLRSLDEIRVPELRALIAEAAMVAVTRSQK